MAAILQAILSDTFSALLKISLLQIFGHAMAAYLSCHAQNFVAIIWLGFDIRMMPTWLLESINTFYWCQPHQWQCGESWSVTASKLSSRQGSISMIHFFNFNLAVIQSLLIRSLTTSHVQNSCCIMGNILRWLLDGVWDGSELIFLLSFIYNSKIISKNKVSLIK